MSLLTHVLACLFGMGSWVAINGMWVELPLIVPKIPEGWYLPSYLTVLIQMANIGPLFITLMHHFRPGVLDERPVIYCIVFFVFLSVMMVVCMIAFILLNHHPSVARERKNDLYFNGDLVPGKREQGLSLHAQTPEQKPMIGPGETIRREPRSSFGLGTYSSLEVLFIFIVLAWVNALTNAVLPSVQSYSCLPYGNKAYHLAATMAAVANPVACFIAMFMPIRSLILMGFLTMIGTGFGAYIMAMAALSPCPLLVHSASGTTVIVLTWILFVLSLSYVKVIIGVILRDEGHSALVWCGAVVQLGSMVGAVSMFPLVSVYRLFKSGDACNTKCPM